METFFSSSQPSSCRYVYRGCLPSYYPAGKCRCEHSRSSLLENFLWFPLTLKKRKQKCELSFNNFDNSTFHHLVLPSKQKITSERRRRRRKQRKKLIFSLTNKNSMFFALIALKFTCTKSIIILCLHSPSLSLMSSNVKSNQINTECSIHESTFTP